MNNKESIKHVYDEIHAPDALFGKVMEMDKKESKMRKVCKCAMAAAATLAIAMVASNGICYAATGETWISKAIVYINGDATEQEMTWHRNGDTVYGEIEVPVEEGDGSQVEMFSFASDGELPDEVYVTADDGYVADGSSEAEYTEDAFSARLEEENGKLFLVAGETRIDITEDFKDGEATGTFDFEGLTLRYMITGTQDDCEIKLTCE